MQNNHFTLALEAFDRADYQEAFTSMNEMPVKEAIRLLLLTRPLKLHYCESNFWESLINHSKHLEDIINSVYAPKIIHYYWNNFPDSGCSIFEYLAENKPELLWQTIRQNELFRDEGKWNNLTWSTFNNPVIDKNLKFINAINNWYKKNETCLHKYDKELKQLEYPTIFKLLAYWYSKKIQMLEDDKIYSEGSIYPETINECLNYYRKLKGETNEQVPQNKNSHVESEEEWFFQLMDRFEDRIDFTLNTVYTTYCYDMAFDIELNDKTVQLVLKNPKSYHQWKINGGKLRCFFNEIDYTAECLIIIEAENNRLGAIYDKDIFNQIATVESAKTRLLAGYYGIGSEDTNFTIDLATVLNGFSINALKNNDTLLRIETTESLKKIISSAIQIPSNSEKIIKNISTDSGSSQIDININIQPFVFAGSHYFLLNQVLANTNIPVSLVNAWLIQNSNSGKNEVMLMEEKLRDLLKCTGFECESNKKHKSEDGTKTEFDIVAYHPNKLLLIEMKRTRMSDTLKDNYIDYSNNLLSAAMQLYRNEKMINDDPKLLLDFFPSLTKDEISSLQVHKWIVTNSFEYDHEEIDGCLKISLFELQENINQLLDTSLENKPAILLHMITSGEYWKDKPIDDNMNLPLGSVYCEFDL